MSAPPFAVIVPISIHALREEGDLKSFHKIRFGQYFYPRPPRGGRLAGAEIPATRSKHFYPRPPRGGRRETSYTTERGRKISIHALREEGDIPLNFAVLMPLIFLSTPSARRATLWYNIYRQFA
mgnify:CR=1 FL=1